MSARCLITYDPISEGKHYSKKGLAKLASGLKQLRSLTLNTREQTEEASRRAQKMSIQGVQPKLSAKLNIKQGRFDIVDSGGRYILKPPVPLFREVPENEDVSMHLARLIGIEAPVHGLIYSPEGERTYFIKRFDRKGQRDKLAVEDFGQLLGASRNTKYDSSVEQLIKVIHQFTTFPMVESVKFLTRVLFNFIIGNEDMHLKNYSLISRNKKIELAPAFDFLSTTLAMQNASEETALPLNGKKQRLLRSDFVHYLAKERLHLQDLVIDQVLENIKSKIPTWNEWIKISFLSSEMKQRYLALIKERVKRLDL